MGSVILRGDARAMGLADGSVDCVVTSPPYWGLRAYAGLEASVWGGDPACVHEWGSLERGKRKDILPGDVTTLSSRTGTTEKQNGAATNGGQFCQKCGAWRGYLGLEPTPDLFVENMVAVFREVWRVLKPWGCVFMNLGDSYNGVGGQGKQDGGPIGPTAALGGVSGKHAPKLKPGDQCLIPHRVAMALQADGWWVRSTVVWAKGISFNPDYAGSVMPESTKGWRWERCRVKVKAGWGEEFKHPGPKDSRAVPHSGDTFHAVAQWTECPGCAKCAPNGGLVLRKGSWRPTSAFEYVFLLAKSADYYCDGEAVREKAEYGRKGWHDPQGTLRRAGGNPDQTLDARWTGSNPDAGRNPRNVFWLPADPHTVNGWTDLMVLNPQAFKASHFATFPEKLVEQFVKCGTSEKGNCPACGMPWVRVVESSLQVHRHSKSQDQPKQRGRPDQLGFRVAVASKKSKTLGWRPSCGCNAGDPVPAVVLDPFAGSGTTPMVAHRLGRHGIGNEASAEYCRMARERIAKDTGEAPEIVEVGGGVRVEQMSLFDGTN